MNRDKYLVMLPVLSLALVACVASPAAESDETESKQAALQPTTFQGVDDRGQPCSYTVGNDARESLTLHGTYKVDYKIPTPGSGIYGINYWDATFDGAFNFVRPPAQRRAFWGGGDVVEGKGKPLFWDGDDAFHVIVARPSLGNPKEVTYHTTHRIAGVVPMVVIDLACKF